MTLKKFSSVILTAAILFGLSLAQAEADYKTKLTLTIAAAGPVYDEAYLLSVPADFTITRSGWNSIGSITAKYNGTNAGFDPAKKLVVTATSTNSFKLTASGVTDTISYSLMSGDSASSAVEMTTFEFTAAEINKEGGTSRPIGVNVEDYSTKSAGDYEDEITYTVSVESAVTTKTVTFSTSTDGKTINKDGVTCTDSFDTYNNLPAVGTFSVSSGHFTQIVVTANDTSLTNLDSSYNAIAGWSASASSATWTGSASSVQFGTIMGNQQNVTIVFTIEE